MECRYEGKTRRYITSLIDDKRFTKDKVAQLYLQRWEIEMAFREIKSDLQEGLVLRSKLPQLVLQEFWGLMIAYNLIRRLMRYMA
ncbi:transposase, partial [Psychrobacter faecalis]